MTEVYKKDNRKPGEERRKTQRRRTADRRIDIRFEPGKDDRRTTKRRNSDRDIWEHHEE